MRIDLREVELACDQEDHSTDSREPAITAGLALGGLEEAIQGFQEAIGGACLGPGDDAFEVGAYEAGHGLHGLGLGESGIPAPAASPSGARPTRLAVRDLAKRLAIHSDLSGALCGHVRHEGIEITLGDGIQVAGILQECLAQALQGGVGFLLGASHEVKRMGGVRDDRELVEGGWALGNWRATPLMKAGDMSIETCVTALGSPPWAGISWARRSIALASRSEVSAMTARREASAARHVIMPSGFGCLIDGQVLHSGEILLGHGEIDIALRRGS